MQVVLDKTMVSIKANCIITFTHFVQDVWHFLTGIEVLFQRWWNSIDLLFNLLVCPLRWSPWWKLIKFLAILHLLNGYIFLFFILFSFTRALGRLLAIATIFLVLTCSLLLSRRKLKLLPFSLLRNLLLLHRPCLSFYILVKLIKYISENDVFWIWYLCI